MRHVLMPVFALLALACTSMRPVEEPIATLQQQILNEGLVASGDEVRVVTTDGVVHQFRVRDIDLDAGTVSGDDDAVAIASIVTLEKREFSALKTGLLVGGVVLGLLGTSCEASCDESPGPFCCG